MVPIAGLVGAMTLTSISGRLTRDAWKHLTAPLTYVLGGLLGAFSGAILLGLTAVLGMTAAWLGLLTPVVSAGLSSAVFQQAFRRLRPSAADRPGMKTPAIQAMGWLGAVIGFSAAFLLLNVRQALIEGVLPPQTVVFEGLGVTLYAYLLQAMILGVVLGGAAGAMAGTKANVPIGNVLYSVTRTLLNALRSIEPLIMGLVFVIWVGIGPFAGVLALALHSVASLGKLYSEQIETIDSGPIEALQSTGANRLQTIMYAVVPQIIPPYIAFTMYRWDINVRMSTIIGFVGGGGIGFLLSQQLNLLRYRDAGVAVLAIAIVVSALDYASAYIRERYT
ncbi:MAG: ABC transporter permease subunit [Chloroflexi bacterium]|nr:ABC transporter permease subunit [Chloroflexota bacterium]